MSILFMKAEICGMIIPAIGISRILLFCGGESIEEKCYD
jgi:hypothetical protein